MIMQSEGEKRAVRYLRDTMHIKTGIKWIAQHNGWRPGKMHVIMGASHAGKSTLVRSILYDYFSNNSEGFCGMWLSEESLDDLKEGLIDLKMPQRVEVCLDVETEYDMKDRKEATQKLISFMDRHKPNLFIIDNITTSITYEGVQFSQATEILHQLKKAAHRNNTALIVIAHSRADIGEYSGRIIEPNDVRGSKTIVNLSQFFYVLQNFKINGSVYPTLRVVKHRGYDYTHVKHTFWNLEYDPQTKTSIQSWFINWATFKEKYKESDKLKGN